MCVHAHKEKIKSHQVEFDAFIEHKRECNTLLVLVTKQGRLYSQSATKWTLNKRSLLNKHWSCVHVINVIYCGYGSLSARAGLARRNGILLNYSRASMENVMRGHHI